MAGAREHALFLRPLEAFAALCQALLQPAPLDLRVNTLKTNRDEMLRQLQAEGIEAAPTTLAP